MYEYIARPVSPIHIKKPPDMLPARDRLYLIRIMVNFRYVQ